MNSKMSLVTKTGIALIILGAIGAFSTINNLDDSILAFRFSLYCMMSFLGTVLLAFNGDFNRKRKE